MAGCRSGELHELRKSDIEILPRDRTIEEDKKPFHQRRYGFIRVRRGWNVRLKKVGSTKAGYWRNVPVSSEFYWFLVNELKLEEKRPEDHLFRRFWEWDKGLQASILRGFCESNGLPSIKFHTLRVCFATQLIATGVPPTVVMKICGWRDMTIRSRRPNCTAELLGGRDAGCVE